MDRGSELLTSHVRRRRIGDTSEVGIEDFSLLRRELTRDKPWHDAVFFFEGNEMRQQLTRGGRPQASIDAGIDATYERRDRRRLFFELLQHLTFAHTAVLDVLNQLCARIEHFFTVTAIDRPRITMLVKESLQSALIRSHRSPRRSDDDRAHSEHHVAGEE